MRRPPDVIAAPRPVSSATARRGAMAAACALAMAVAATTAVPAQTLDDTRSPSIERYLDFPDDSRIRGLGLPVGMLDIIDSAGSERVCTAFIISELYILTNAHCVPGDFTGSNLVGDFRPSPRASEVTLIMGLVSDDGAGAQSYDVDVVPAETSRIYDYSVLRVLGNPSRDWGKVKLSLEDTVEGQPGLVLHHPDGDPLRVTRRNCFLLDVVPKSSVSKLLFDELIASRSVSIDIRFRTSCAVEPGSSGAPFFSQDTGHVVGLISSTSNVPDRSRAIPITLIATTSQIVRDLARTEGSQDEAPPSLAQGPLASLAGLSRKAFDIDERCANDKPIELVVSQAWSSLCATEIAPLCFARTQPNDQDLDVVISILAESSLTARQALEMEIVANFGVRSGELVIGGNELPLDLGNEPGILTPSRGIDMLALIDLLLAAQAQNLPVEITIGRSEPRALPLAGFDVAVTAMLRSCGYVE